MAAELHLAENALALHLLLQRLEGLVDVVVADENLHASSFFSALRSVRSGNGQSAAAERRAPTPPRRALYQNEPACPQVRTLRGYRGMSARSGVPTSARRSATPRPHLAHSIREHPRHVAHLAARPHRRLAVEVHARRPERRAMFGSRRPRRRSGWSFRRGRGGSACRAASPPPRGCAARTARPRRRRCVQWPELCTRGAISLTSRRAVAADTNISTASTPT